MTSIPHATTTEIETLKALVPLAVPAVKTTIENWLAPAISKLLKHKEVIKNSKPEHIEKVFEEYLLRSYNKLSYMNTIVFGNQQKRIQDLYIPLTLISVGPREETFLINGWRDDLIPAYKRIVITDTAGMGKSTILKWLFLCSFGTSKGIPIFLELRTLSSQKPILEKIYDDLCPVDKPFDKELLLHLIKEGKFIFFLDGFDEIAFEDRKVVTEDIQGFMGKAFGNHFALASRHESALGSFGDFREFTIKPLKKSEAYALLRKYDESQEHSETLIAELEHSKYEQLKDLMVNPMLVSLLYKAYSYKPKVPFKKQIFYRQVFDALFDMHDSTKGGAFVRKKQCNLDIEEFHLVMRDLGFTTAKLGKIEYERDSISDIIKKVRERNPSVLFQPAALLSDLVTTVPLFNREGDHYKWAHKSVQDYFASQFIALDAKANEVPLLERIYDGGHCRRFENVLDMLHDTDNKTFRRVLLAKLLREYIYHHESTYTSVFPGISEQAIELRRQLTFGVQTGIAWINNEQLNSIFRSPDLMGRFQELPFAKKFNPEGLMIMHMEKKICAIAFSHGPAYGLLRLLSGKGYSYITKQKIVSDEAKVKKLPRQGHIVTDDPKCPLNSVDLFEGVNDLLSHNGFLLPIEQIRRTVKAIEEESSESEQVSQIFQNL